MNLYLGYLPVGYSVVVPVLAFSFHETSEPQVQARSPVELACRVNAVASG